MELAGEISRVDPRLERSPQIEGALADREDLDRALAIDAGADDSERVARIHERHGTDGFLRLRGRFALALLDPVDRRLVLAADPSGAVSLFYRIEPDRIRFATRIGSLLDARPSLDTEALRTWLRSGEWPAGRTAYAGIAEVPPGAAIRFGSNVPPETRPFWTFRPFNIPRELPIEEARGELTAALDRAIARSGIRASPDPVLIAEPPFGALLEPLLPNTRRVEHGSAISLAQLERAAASLDLPLGVEALAKLASLEGSAVTDWGARAMLGGDRAAVRAWVLRLAGSIEEQPSLRRLQLILRRGALAERALGEGALLRALGGHGAHLLHRWSRHGPPGLTRLLERLPLRSAPSTPPITGDPFTDQRFRAARSRARSPLHQALTRAGGVAPFLDPAVVELVFSLPARHFTDGRRTLLLAGAGESITESVSEPPAVRPDLAPAIARARRSIDLDPRESTAPASMRRLAGLGLFLESRPLGQSS